LLIPGRGNYFVKQWQKSGDYDVWSFFRKADYEDKLKRQPFLAGQQEQIPTT